MPSDGSRKSSRVTKRTSAKNSLLSLKRPYTLDAAIPSEKTGKDEESHGQTTPTTTPTTGTSSTPTHAITRITIPPSPPPQCQVSPPNIPPPSNLPAVRIQARSDNLRKMLAAMMEMHEKTCALATRQLMAKESSLREAEAWERLAEKVAAGEAGVERDRKTEARVDYEDGLDYLAACFKLRTMMQGLYQESF
ncbi:Ff.00g040670.m01.CDS01 [Fusarium sp. VM40]|nr:Ff.00g040670.m01.CDS01 [Fusarium sp. VM40]